MAYITRTRATQISHMVHFKHQYITNPTISQESHVVVTAKQLATALKGNMTAGNETVEALTWVSKLLKKITTAKNERAKAKEQRNKLQANPAARKCTPPRVEVAYPRVEVTAPRVATPHTSKKRNAWNPIHGPNYIS